MANIPASLSGVITPGTISATLAVMGIIAMSAGKPALAAFFNDPETAANLIALIAAALALFAGASRGLTTPAA